MSADATSASLLERLAATSDAGAWQRLVDIYTPLIRGWLLRHAVQDADCSDLVQEVLAVVTRKLPAFQHNQRRGAFRSWLRAITTNCLRDFWKARRYRPRATGDSDFQDVLAQMEDPASGVSRLWDQEHDRHVTRKLLELLQPQFEPRTWTAFVKVAVEGADADRVAAELKMTVNAVWIAKSRVLARLRQEASGLIE
ncbi:MAG: sigma-70 family RNA polymerase sigma factor [Gemmataceae bacterium]|nr:sigma-70 family RNA polymerase sigma factor [Gemmataceae bacterium]